MLLALCKISPLFNRQSPVLHAHPCRGACRRARAPASASACMPHGASARCHACARAGGVVTAAGAHALARALGHRRRPVHREEGLSPVDAVAGRPRRREVHGGAERLWQPRGVPSEDRRQRATAARRGLSALSTACMASISALHDPSAARVNFPCAGDKNR